MRLVRRWPRSAALCGGLAVLLAIATSACSGGNSGSGSPARQGLGRVNHFIILMQENHSFDNYFGVLPYAANTPYHPAAGADGCAATDSSCVDGLSCSGVTPQTCSNFNYDGSAAMVSAAHATDYCPSSPLHDWASMHLKANYCDPNSTTSLSDGFVLQDGSATPMSYYNEDDLPFYYALAETFAISDRQFASLVGPTLPDRMYAMAATSFGHNQTADPDDHTNGPPGYQPITGSIFDLLDMAHQSWAEYWECDAIGTPPVPYAQLFRYGNFPNFVHLTQPSAAALYPEFAAATQGARCQLPAVTYLSLYHTEHPNDDILAGQYDAAVLLNDLRTGPCWKDSVLFLTYDEGGGFYDHVAPPLAVSPDGIPPGLCADQSNPPSSETPGNGTNCGASLNGRLQLNLLLLPGEAPADFTQLGFRVPLIVVSPFAKPHYVSHVVGDHTSMLRMIEKRFTHGRALTKRDAAASDLSDMFDFADAPSLNTPLPVLPAMASDSDPGCSGAPKNVPAQSCAMLASPLPTPASPLPTPTASPTTAACPLPTPLGGGLPG